MGGFLIPSPLWGEGEEYSGRHGHALPFKAHGLAGDNLAALAGFHHAVD